ncbi:MAG: putative lipid II flippase FtsW [Victivallaceae bacterium]
MKLFLIVCLLGIFSLGLVMVFETSSAEVLDKSLSCGTHRMLFKQLTYAFMGLFFGFLIWKIGYEDVLRISPLFFWFFVVLLGVVFIPNVGIARNGARRWIGVGSFTIQPSEFMKYLVPMMYIEKITSRSSDAISFFFFLKLLVILFIPIFLITVEPDNGTAAVICSSLVPLFFVNRIKLRFWLLPLSLVFLLGGAMAYNLPYVRGRVHVYLHPELDIKGKGHQPYQAKIAAGSGKIFGKGPGASLQKLTYLPEAQNDYIVAIYAEEFGFIGVLCLILLYMFFIYSGFAIADRASSVRGACLATAITFLVSFQAFLNFAVVSGLLPSKGVNLPFFSQGGSSLVANIWGVFLLLKVYCYEKKGNYFSRWDSRTYKTGSRNCR